MRALNAAAIVALSLICTYAAAIVLGVDLRKEMKLEQIALGLIGGAAIVEMLKRWQLV